MYQLYRHLVYGVGDTESCYMKQSILYNVTDWYAPEVSLLLFTFTIYGPDYTRATFFNFMSIPLYLIISEL